MTFEQWLYKVCEIIANRHHREITDVFSSIDLYDAKLQFLDGVKPEEFSTW